MGFRTNLLKFDKNSQPEDFTFQLATKNLTHLGKLNNVDRESVHYVGNLNGADEISLKVYKTVNGEVEKLWDSIVDLKLLYVAEVGEYFEIKVSLDDELNGYKTLTCTSLCEAELSELNIYETEINTEADIDRPDYEITTFYNEGNPKASLLHRILNDKAPHYTIKHVDDSLKKLQRSFSINGTSIYDFLTGECAEQFNCMFVFNSPDRSISVYDLYTVCNDCGYRGAYSDVCPECGSDFLNYFGNDTTIYIDKDNFAENIKFETTEAIKNCSRLVAGDDIMTATIRSLNQNGSNYIFYFTDEMKQDMSEELVEKLYAYDVLYDSYIEEYEQLLTDYYKAVDDELYYTSSMMPEAPSDDEDTDNEISITNQEIEKLTVDNLSPIGLTSVTITTSIATVNSAIKNYAKVFVNSGLVKVDTLDSTFVYKGKNGNGDNYGEWTGKIQLTNYSDEEDVATTDVLTLTVHDNYADFVEQKVLKNIANDDEDHSIYDVIKIEDINEFKEALTYYSLNRLESFRTAIESAIDVLIEVNEGSKDAELYNRFYTPYVDKLEACEDEMDVRQATIDGIITTKKGLLDSISGIQETLNFEAYLGDLYKEFCAYRREDEYNNSNYISDGLDNAELIERARQFIEAAKKELYKSATKQNTITADLYNLLAMTEFKPLVENFALGNFIRVNVDGTIYRLRLINFEIGFSDLTKLPVQFSDVTITKNGLNDVKSILDSAKSVGNNFAYVSKQAEKGQIANSTFEQMYQDGLNSALYRIKNNDNEEVIIDKGGILGRSFDDIENDYSQEQMKLTHNLLVYTRDGFRSVSCALGKHNYYKFVNGEIGQYTAYGLTSDFVTSGVVNGSQIIGGDIYSTNYSSTEGTHINLNDGSFTFGGGSLTYNITDGLKVQGNITSGSTITGAAIKGGSIEIGDVFSAKENEVKITGIINAKKGGTIGGFTIGDDAIYKNTDSLGSNTPGIYLGTDGIRNYNSDTANVTIKDGILIANGGTFSGTIHAGEGGTIGGWAINEDNLTGGDLELKSDGSITGKDWSISKDGAANFSNITINNSGSNGNSNTLIWGENFSISKTGSITASEGTINGNLYVINAQEEGLPYAKKGKMILRGADNLDGRTVNSYETVLRGLQYGWKEAGAFFIRRITNNMSDATYDTDAAYKYPFMVSGTGNLTIGENQEFKVTGSTGNVTIGGTCTISGSTTISGSCTASNINATGGQIGGWKIDGTKLTGSNSENQIVFNPEGTILSKGTNSYRCYIIIYDSGGVRPLGGLSPSGWITL